MNMNTTTATSTTETAVWAYIDDRKTDGDVCYLSSLISNLGIFQHIPKAEIIYSINNMLQQNKLLVQINNRLMVTLERPVSKVIPKETPLTDGHDKEVGMTPTNLFDDALGAQIDIEEVITKELSIDAQQIADSILAELVGVSGVSEIPEIPLDIMSEMLVEVVSEATEVVAEVALKKQIEDPETVLRRRGIDAAPSDFSVDVPKKEKKQTKQIKANIPRDIADWFMNLSSAQRELAEKAMAAALESIKNGVVNE